MGNPGRLEKNYFFQEEKKNDIDIDFLELLYTCKALNQSILINESKVIRVFCLWAGMESLL